jgi:bifunctional ADP-heptose synthase (sugar kinase/adenylyltransferase)
MTLDQVQEILKKISKVRVAVYGDFCLDAYWILNPRGGEISVETGLRTEVAENQYYTLGGASNVVANLAALQPERIRAIGATGDDMFGRELRRQLDALRVDTSGLIMQKENFDTFVFVKKVLNGVEGPRVDLGYFNQRTTQTDEAILQQLQNALENNDAVIFNQQVEKSIQNEPFFTEVNRLFEKYCDRTVLLDSRHFGHRIKNVIRKLNGVEAARLCGVNTVWNGPVPLEDVKTYAKVLYHESGKPVFVTRSEQGIVVADNDGLHEIRGIQFEKPLDPVGAGDTALSALALCLGAGASAVPAAEFANLAAAVTVQKLFQTGTASGEEISELCRTWICLKLRRTTAFPAPLY